MGESSGKKREEAREFWAEAIRLCEESGLSVREFCRREGLGENSLHSWRKKLRDKGSTSETRAETVVKNNNVAASRRRKRSEKRGDAVTSKEAIEFMPVRVVAEEAIDSSTVIQETLAADTPIEVAHTSGWFVRVQAGFDATTLDTVLTVLERRAC